MNENQLTPERWQQVKQIFHSALERDPVERVAFLCQACSDDDELRAEVESLISAYEQPGSFMDSPAYEEAASVITDSEAESVIGWTLGSYRVIALLGAGGMGEVYLARDTRLGRKVALKMVPPEMMKSDRRSYRLLREAQAASMLNHPNIVTVHSLEEAEGRDFIVMEYVEGETLKAVIERGPLAVERVIELGEQAGSALEAAHRVGLIHRDIKSSNILITKRGEAKVLDFGLAKLVGRSLGEGITEAGEMRSELTDTGVVVGTVSYMSPEQTRGEELDGRSDIFSLGCVLYEAATGRLPFNGVSTLAIMNEIRTVEPPAPSEIEARLPREFDEIIHRALAKDKEQRYGSAAEMVEELKGLRVTASLVEERETSGETGTPKKVATAEMGRLSSSGDPAAAVGERLRSAFVRYRKLIVGLVAALALVAIILGLQKALRTKPNESSEAMKLTRLTNNGKVLRAAISPDGKYVAYVARHADKLSIWVRQVASAANLEVVPPASVFYWGLTFSPDGNHIYFVRAEGGIGTAIYQVPVLGGPIRKMIETAHSSFAVSPDGKQFAYVRESTEKKETALIVANADGSGERALAVRHAPDFFYAHQDSLSWSPDGRVIACHAGSTDEKGYYRNVVGVQVKDGSEQPITSKRWKWIGGLAWMSDGTGLLLIASDHSAGWDARQVWEIAYPDGEARRITNDLSGYAGLSLTADAKTLLTVQETDISNMWIVPGTKVEQARLLTSGNSDGQDGMAWTPDGRIVYTSKASGGNDLQLWIMDADGSNQKPLTASPGSHEEPAVSADGRYIVFSARASDDLSANIWRIDIDGGNPKQLTRGGHDMRPHCSPDGKWVVYTHRPVPTMPTLWKVPIEGGEPVQLHDAFTFGNAISPDGTLIACGYRGQASNWHNKIALIPINGGPPVRLFDIPPRISAYDPIQWTPDGRALTCNNKGATKIWKQSLDGSPAKELIDFQFDTVWRSAWSPDGARLAVARGSTVSDAVLISNFR
ncbi:MAG: protein kinase [Acidobacteriota bacterium]